MIFKISHIKKYISEGILFHVVKKFSLLIYDII